jgi:hypothetical protein
MAVTPEEFIQATRDNLLCYSTMIAIMRDDDGERRLIDSGSGAFLNTGTAKFLVTNSHVYKGYLKYREEAPTTTLWIYGGQDRGFFEITYAVLLGRDDDCDLATLSIPPEMVAALGKSYLPFDTTKSRRADTGMLTIMIGYAGKGPETAEGKIPLRLIQAGGVVASVSDRKIVIHDESGETIWLCPPERKPPHRLGGISGSPVYIWDIFQAPESNSNRLFLGGFAMEALDNTTVLATHADHIKADGMIE